MQSCRLPTALDPFLAGEPPSFSNSPVPHDIQHLECGPEIIPMLLQAPCIRLLSPKAEEAGESDDLWLRSLLTGRPTDACKAIPSSQLERKSTRSGGPCVGGGYPCNLDRPSSASASQGDEPGSAPPATRPKTFEAL